MCSTEGETCCFFLYKERTVFTSLVHVERKDRRLKLREDARAYMNTWTWPKCFGFAVPFAQASRSFPLNTIRENRGAK